MRTRKSKLFGSARYYVEVYIYISQSLLKCYLSHCLDLIDLLHLTTSLDIHKPRDRTLQKPPSYNSYKDMQKHSAQFHNANKPFPR